jgi:hypothetical protein
MYKFRISIIINVLIMICFHSGLLFSSEISNGISDEEFIKSYCGVPVDVNEIPKILAKQDSLNKAYYDSKIVKKSLQIESIPDWTSMMSDGEDQEDSESCWCHSATGVVECMLHILHGSNIQIDLDELEIQSHFGPYGTPGLTKNAFKCIRDSTAYTESTDQFPNYDNARYSVLWDATSDSLCGIQAIKDALVYGPVSFCMFIYEDYLGFFENDPTGVYWWNENPCSEILGGHAMVIVSYNEDDPGNPYWIVKDSFHWEGAGGGGYYIKIGMGQLCGIESWCPYKARIDSSCFAKITPGLISDISTALSYSWAPDNNEDAYLNTDYSLTSNTTLPADKKLWSLGSLTIPSGDSLVVAGTLNMGASDSLNVYGTLTLGGTLQKIPSGNNWSNLNVRSGGSLVTNSGATIKDCASVKLYEEPTIQDTLYLGPDVDVEVYDTLTIPSGKVLTKIPNEGNWGYLDVNTQGSLTINGTSTISNCDSLNIYGSMTINNTLQLGPDVNVVVHGYGALTISTGSTLTKIPNNDNWGDLDIKTNGSLAMGASSTIEYGNSVQSSGSLSFPGLTPWGQTCHIQHCTNGMVVNNYSPIISNVHFVDNYRFLAASEGWVHFYYNTVSGSDDVNDYGVCVTGNSGLDLLVSMIETFTGPCACIDANATLWLEENNNSLIPYNNNLAIDNPPGKVVWAERNYWGREDPDSSYFAAIFANPDSVRYSPWCTESYGGAWEKRAIEEQQALALSGILRSYCEGNWESAQENLNAFIGQTDNADQKRGAICTLLQIVKDHGLDGSRVRGVIEHELLTAKGKYRASLDYLWCDSFMYEGKYEQAFKEFSAKVAMYKGTSREGDMLAKMAVITADCFRDEAKALEYVNMAKALNPGQPSLRGAFRAVGVNYDPKQYTNKFEGVAENFDKLGEPIEQKPIEQEVAEEFLTLSPNPFNPVTMFNYSIKENARVKLTVYSITGQKIATLVDSPMAAGTHSVVFDGSNLASGIYLYKFESPGFAKTGKMLMVK